MGNIEKNVVFRCIWERVGRCRVDTCQNTPDKTLQKYCVICYNYTARPVCEQHFNIQKSKAICPNCSKSKRLNYTPISGSVFIWIFP